MKKLMPVSLLNYRFRGTTLSYEELLIALENIIIDTSAPMGVVFQTCLGVCASLKGRRRTASLCRN